MVTVEEKLPRDAWNSAAGQADRTQSEGVHELFLLEEGQPPKPIKPF